MEIKDIENKIINADCMDILKQLPDKCIDLVLTDPPYGIGFGTFNRTNKLKNGQRVKANKYKNSDLDSAIPDIEIFNEMRRVSKNQVIWGGNYFPELWKDGGRCFLFWKKNNPCKNFGAGELAWTSFDENCKCYDYNYYGNIEGGGIAEQKIHPTQKPVAIMERCLQDFSKEGQLILDCFSGSGTTAIACHRLKRRFICIEKDPEYWKASCKRLEDEQRQGTLF